FLKSLNDARHVALYSHAKGALQTPVRFGQDVVLICCLLAPTEGLRVVLRHKAPESIREANHRLRVGVALLRPPFHHREFLWLHRLDVLHDLPTRSAQALREPDKSERGVRS